MVFERFEKSPDEPSTAPPYPAVVDAGGASSLQQSGAPATQAGPLTPQDLIDYTEWASSDGPA
jgi:hypothetical protein